MLNVATKFRPEAEAFERACRAGFGCAELWLSEGVLAGWQEVAALARSYPLRYALHFPNKVLSPQSTVEQTVELYRALACRALVLHQPLADSLGADLSARAPDVRQAVENHRLSPEEFEAWAERNAGLALDVEHLWMMTWPGTELGEVLGKVGEFLRKWGEKLEHVHLPGWYPGQPEHRPMYCGRDLVLGVFDLLAGRGFDGLVVSEVNPEFQNPYDLRMDVLLYEGWQARRGG